MIRGWLSGGVQVWSEHFATEAVKNTIFRKEKNMRITWKLFVPVIWLLMVFVASVQAAETYPAKDITLVVQWAGGGSTDLAARESAVPLQKFLGRAINIKNVAGGSGAVGTVEVMRAKPDGYTVLFSSPGPIIVLPHVAEVPYDPFKDIVNVAGLGAAPIVILAKKDAPYNNLKEMDAYFRQPGKELRYGSAGAGTVNHLWMVMLSRAMKLPMTHVPFQHSAEGVTNVLGGHVDVTSTEPITAIAPVKEGRAKLLTVFGSDRIPYAPDVLNVKEQGYTTAAQDLWHAFYVPKGTPQPIVDRLTEAIKKASEDPEFQKIAAKTDRSVKFMSATDFTALTKAQSAVIADIAKAEGLGKK